ncbi:MAG TPA: hypothetical protein VJ123_04080 [Anaerolineales bacterium]|nr:hypothetical protein [Anaerolineales bacterium]
MLAHQLRGSDPSPPERNIDEAFIFRFEHNWCQRVAHIRQLVSRLTGRRTTDHLPEEVAIRVWVHLDLNKGLNISFRIAQGKEASVSLTTTSGAYHPYDEALKPDITALMGPSPTSDPQTRARMAGLLSEARLTAEIQDKILTLARVYQIIPMGDDQWRQFPLDRIEIQLVDLRNFLLFQFPVPALIWDNIAFIESRIPSFAARWLRPNYVSSEILSNRRHRSHYPRTGTRIRTWAIYFLTRRGGGALTEASAVAAWNLEFNDTLEQRNFRSDRDRLLRLGSRIG